MSANSINGRGVEGKIELQIGYYSASGKSLTRHLETWRRRYVGCHSGLLFLGDTAATALPYCLIPHTLKRNYYASSGHPHALSVCCLNGQSGQEMEVKFSFHSKEEENSWGHVFESMLEGLGQQQQYILLSTVKCVSNYLHGRHDKIGSASAEGDAGALPGLLGEDEDGFEVVEDPTLALIRGMRLQLADNRPGLSEPVFMGHTCLSRATLRSRLRPYWTLPIPKLRVLIMTVGTRGDVQPFILLGQRLQRDGHRVRLATHEMYRDFVCRDNGLEFYPLGGDPQWLSQFMVKTKGFLVPMTMETISQVPKNVAMINDIIHSCWGACIYPDPKDGLKRPFIADAIISNPVTYGHVHCAEALGVPLHLMFPQPWVPTKAFPHPLSGMKYTNAKWSPSNFLSYQTVDRVMWQSFLPYVNNFRVNTLKLEPIRFLDKTWDLLNHHRVPFVKMWSRHLAPKPKDWPNHVDIVGAFVNKNDYSVTSGIKNMSRGIKLTSSDDNLLALASSAREVNDNTSKAPNAMEVFLSLPGAMPPIFVGFGSMVVDKPEHLIRTMLEGAAMADVRILVQSGWSDINQEWFLRTSEGIERRYNKSSAFERVASSEDFVPRNDILGAISQPMASSASSSTDSNASNGSGVLRPNSDSLSSRDRDSLNMPGASQSRPKSRWRATDALLIGNYPHDKLFPRVSAVVHHGGAGTTAGGLIAGKPTFICPFFGDQSFWGEMVQRAGLGPAPCPVEQLTPELVAEKFIKLLSADVQSRARKVSQDMKAEGDGVELGLLAFYRHLPVENMICDVSLMRHEVRLAQVYCKTCGLKMARNVSDSVHASVCVRPAVNGEGAHVTSGHDVVPCVYKDWSLPPPTGVMDGVLQGAGALAHETLGAIADAFTDPLKGMYNGGLQGGLHGVYSGIRSLATRPVEGTRVMYNKVQEGMRSTGLVSKPHGSGVAISSDVEKTEDKEGHSWGSAAGETVGSSLQEESPEQAARWYGEASMIMMSSAAQARVDRSFLFSEEGQGGPADSSRSVGTLSILPRYGTQPVMESTIIEELDNEDCESIVDDSDTAVARGTELLDDVIRPSAPSQSVVLSDGTISTVEVPDLNCEVLSSSDVADEDPSLPSISGILNNLDSTNAAIRRYSAGTASVILGTLGAVGVIGIDDETNLAVIPVSTVVSQEEEEEAEVQSIVEEDDESESSSVILGSSYESRVSRVADRPLVQDISSPIYGTLPHQSARVAGICNEESVLLHDSTRSALDKRTVMQCYFMAQHLQKIFSSIAGREDNGARSPSAKDFEILIAAAESKSNLQIDREMIKECGKLLAPPDLLYSVMLRNRRKLCFTDIALLYLQEELPGNNAIDNAAAVEGLTSIYWCHQMDDAKEVWIDEGENI